MDYRLKLVLMMGEGPHQDVVECTELSHLSDYSQPHAPGIDVYVCLCNVHIFDSNNIIKLCWFKIHHAYLVTYKHQL